MNLTNALLGDDVIVKDIATNDEELKSFLFSLGCYSGETVSVVTKKRGGYFFSIKDARYNIDEDLAKAIEISKERGIQILCVQIMHHGPFDDEPATVALMNQYIKENGYKNDFSNGRLHHEIYMTDARKVASEKWKTVIRHPICKICN